MSRLNEVTALFYDTKSDVLDSIGNWQDYLTTASRLPMQLLVPIWKFGTRK